MNQVHDWARPILSRRKGNATMTRTFAALAALAAALAACSPAQSQAVQAPAPAAKDPLLTPIAPDYARQWLGETAPAHIHGNTWLVGFEGLNVGLIRTKTGAILIDGALPQAVPAIEAHLKALGVPLSDVKYILSTEPHYDHSGGLAALARDTGATVVASPQAAQVLARGRSGPDDPQSSSLERFPAVQRLRPIADGQTLRLGDVVVTARATPGHTPGSMSWTWRSCEGKDCRDVVFASSLNPIASGGYKYSDPANRALHDGFLKTFKAFRAMPCDILITAHPSQSGGDVKLAKLRAQPKPNPFIDPAACRTYADTHQALFEKRLAKETGR